MAPTKEENGDESQSNTPEYRDRLRTWLIKMIDSGTIPGLHWENDEKTIFRMPWKHAGRQDYSLEEDSRIFMAWAIHSGRYREGIDKPEPIIWKTRLRCALNKMPDIREIPERSRLDISEPYRVYNLLPPVHKDTQIRRRLQRRNSHAQSSDSRRTPPQITSPTFPRKDPITPNSVGPIKFPDPRLQNHANENAARINHLGLNQAARFDIRNSAPWLSSTPLVPGAENRLLQGLNLNCLTSPMNARNLINPYNLFSVQHRDLRSRSQFDFPLLPYQNPILDHQHLHPFFMPPSSMTGLPLGTKPTVPATPFSRSLALAASAAEEMQEASKTNKLRSDEKDEAKCKIELLELEITKWKRAYEKERSMRENIERKHDHLKNSLENMGGDILAIIKRGYPFKDASENTNVTPTIRKPNPVSSRRHSADDKQHHGCPQKTGEVSPRSGRHSAEDKSNATFNHAKNEWQHPKGEKRRHHQSDSKILDLSSPSPTKRPRDGILLGSEDQIRQRKAYRGNSARENDDLRNKVTHRIGERSERTFRFSASSSSRISSDCDEVDPSSSHNQPLVKSPSTSSSCSSAEESLLGSSTLSPRITRASPIVPTFRLSNSNSYPNYSSRVDGPIQVT